MGKLIEAIQSLFKPKNESSSSQPSSANSGSSGGSSSGKSIAGFSFTPLGTSESGERPSPWAEVKNTSGYTLIASGSDFESATTRFVFRYSQKVLDAYNNADTDRKLTVAYNGRKYSVEYMRDIDDRHEEVEIQGKAVTK